MSHLEEIFQHLWEDKYPEIKLERQKKIIPKRRFAFDFAEEKSKVAIEIQGGIWIMSGHTSGKGVTSDCVKSILAAREGWIVLPLVDSMITEEYLQIINEIIQKRRKINNELLRRRCRNSDIQGSSHTKSNSKDNTIKSKQKRCRNRSKIPRKCSVETV